MHSHVTVRRLCAVLACAAGLLDGLLDTVIVTTVPLHLHHHGNNATADHLGPLPAAAAAAEGDVNGGGEGHVEPCSRQASGSHKTMTKCLSTIAQSNSDNPPGLALEEAALAAVQSDKVTFDISQSNVATKAANQSSKPGTAAAAELQLLHQSDDATSHLAVGVLFASGGLVQFVLAPVVGPLIDRFLYEVPLLCALVLEFISTLTYAMSTSYWVTLAARSLQGVGKAIIDPAAMGLIMEMYPKASDRLLLTSVLIMLVSGSVTLGPFFGGYLDEHVGRMAPFVVLDVGLVVVICLLAIVVRPLREQRQLQAIITSTIKAHNHTKKQQQQQQSLKKQQQQQHLDPATKMQLPLPLPQQQLLHKAVAAGDAETVSITSSTTTTTTTTTTSTSSTAITSSCKLLADPYVWLCSGGLFVCYVTPVALESTIALWMTQRFNSTETEIGLALLPSFLSYVLATLLTVFISRKYVTKQWLLSAVFMALEGATCALIPFAPSYACFVVIHMAFAFTAAMTDTMLYVALPLIADQRHSSVYGTILSMAMFSYCLCYTLAPVLGNALVAVGGFTVMVIVNAALKIAYAPLLLTLKKIYEQRASHDELLPILHA